MATTSSAITLAVTTASIASAVKCGAKSRNEPSASLLTTVWASTRPLRFNHKASTDVTLRRSAVHCPCRKVAASSPVTRTTAVSAAAKCEAIRG